MKENVIKLHDKKFKVMIPAAKIEEAVAAVAAKINEDYREKRNPLFLGVGWNNKNDYFIEKGRAKRQEESMGSRTFKCTGNGYKIFRDCF